jgi:predicted ATP-grasp superfamily ATP-dependent carboligase
MAQTLFVRVKNSAFLQNLGTLALLLILFPFNLSLVVASLLWNFFATPFQKKRLPPQDVKRILITGGKMTKALQLARSFHVVGHEVFLLESHKYWLSGHRFSKSVKGFYTLPAPEKDPDGYCQGLLNLVQTEKIDVFIPVSSPVASYYDSLAKSLLPPSCEVIHFDADVTKLLDDKYAFCTKARALGLSAPKVFRFTSPEQILNFDFQADGSQYLLKSIPYDSVRRLDLTKLPFAGMDEYLKTLPITEEKPWVIQEFISGQEYCTHSTVRHGKIRLHCCSKSSPFQVNYEHIERPKIFEWVKYFVKELNLTGQISFDFIETEDGRVFSIECNPRIHSAITMFYDNPEVANAYLNDAEYEQESPIIPTSGSKPTYWLYHELWRLTEVRSLTQLKQWFEKIIKGTDAIFQVNDPLPFLAVHHWQIPLLILNNLRKFKGWIRIDFNIGKLVELGGD